MSELIETFDLNNKSLGFKERDEVYQEIQKQFSETGKITSKVKTVRVILLDSSGKIYIQRRSDVNTENPGLFDKTFGGHIVKGYTWNQTTIKEGEEELGINITIASNQKFQETLKKIDLENIAVVKMIEENSNYLSKRTTRDSYFMQPFITRFYIGYYNGSTQFVDNEVSEIKKFSLHELEDEINNDPDAFTDDIKYIIKKYKKYLIPLKDYLET